MEYQVDTSIEWLEEGVLALPECVNVETAPAILKQLEETSSSFTTVDFIKVKQADSVALALLLNWQILAGHPLKIRNLPSQLATLIDLYDLEEVLKV